MARYSFSGSIPPKFEHKPRRHKQSFEKIATTVVLDKDEAFSCNDETSNKKVSNCSPCFTALQYINNLESKRSYKRKVNLKNLKFFKKSIERFKNYSLI